MLSLTGWFNGLAALGYVIFGIAFGSFIFYKGFKVRARLLLVLGLSIIFAGLVILGPTTDFLTILITGKNLNNEYGIVGILSFMWTAPGVILAIYIGSELLFPEIKKHYTLSIFIIIGVIFEVLLFLYPLQSLTFTSPTISGEDIIDTQLRPRSILYFFVIFFLGSLLIFNGFGFLIKSIQSTGILRKKFFKISIGYFLFIIFMFLDGYLSPGIFLMVIRVGLIFSFVLWYLGVKEEKIKISRKVVQKGRRLEDSHVSLIERLKISKTEKISEEEISFYRKQEICMVCKGKISGLTFVCPNCKGLYCIKCYEALKSLENICWACDTPIDKSKPYKSIKESKAKTDVKIKEDIHKKA